MTIAPAETVSPVIPPARVPPTTMHRSLLRAALLPEQPALDAWRKWRNSVDIETLDPESHHLLSALYPNLVRYGVEDPHISRLKGVYRRTWYANHLLARSIAPILQTLREDGIEPIVIGEMALLSTVYPDYGHRPVYRLDLFVPCYRTLAAIDSLTRIGWTNSYRPRDGERLWKDPLLFWRETAPNDTLSVPIYLHNHLFRAEPQSHTDDRIRKEAIAIDLGGESSLVLDPVAQLLHLSLQNNRQGKRRPIYYLADAATLVNSLTDETDWVELVTRAQHYEIVLPLRYLLNELREVLDLSLPDWVLPSLNRMAIAYSELLDYNLAGDRKLLLLKANLLRSRERLKKLFAGGSKG